MSTKEQRQSWQQTLRELGPRQKEVAELLARHPIDGLSAWEIAEKTGRLVHAIRPRLTELLQLGLIRQCGVHFYEPTQRCEAVWLLVAIEPDGQLLFA